MERHVHLAREGLIGSLVVALLTFTVGCEKQADAEAAWMPPPLAQDDAPAADGREVIGRMVDFIAGHDELVTEAQVTYEAPQESGRTLEFDQLLRVAVRRPDTLGWDTLQDDATADTARFSGGRFTLIKQPANRWGQVEGPTRIRDMVDRLVEEYGVEVPFQDVLLGDVHETWLAGDVTSILYVGEAWVGGDWTDHVAGRKPGADFELWVRKGPQPFPEKLSIDFNEEGARLSYSARFLKWGTSIPETMVFDFTPPPDAEEIELVPVVRP